MVTSHAALLSSVNHRSISSSGVRLHLAEVGEGPLVVFVHGFPESWYSWRHQLGPVAGAGYRAVALDVRGYGRSSAPDGLAAYAMTSLVGDVLAVLDDAGADDAVVIGHDWGAPIAWNTALLRPDRIRGVMGMSVPYSPRGDTPPLDGFRALAGDELFYIEYFQEPGPAEAEVEADVEGWLRGFYFTASGQADPSKPTMGLVPRGGRLADRFQQPAEGQMAWMTDDDLAFYVGEFERTGLTGALNRYRNITRDWQELAAWRFAPVTVPSFFVGGELDGPTRLGRRAIERFDRNLPDLRGSEILAGTGHWVQQERPTEVTDLVLRFLADLDGDRPAPEAGPRAS